MPYYLTGTTNCRSFEEAIDAIYRVPVDVPIGIGSYGDGGYYIDELSINPRQHGQHEYKGEVIEAFK